MREFYIHETEIMQETTVHVGVVIIIIIIITENEK